MVTVGITNPGRIRMSLSSFLIVAPVLAPSLPSLLVVRLSLVPNVLVVLLLVFVLLILGNLVARKRGSLELTGGR
jgi:hypothetical protein